MIPQRLRKLDDLFEWNKTVGAGPLPPYITLAFAVFALVMTIDLVQESSMATPQEGVFILASLLTYSSASLVSRWPWMGFFVFIIGSSIVAWSTDSGGVLLISCAIITTLIFACGSALLMMTSSTMLICWSILVSVLISGDFSFLRAAIVVGVPGACIGFVIGRFRIGISTAKALNLELREQNLLIRAREREALSRDLHDIVANQLTSMTLISGSRAQSEKLEDLQQALREVKELSKEALIELRKLLNVLRIEDVAHEQVSGRLSRPDDLSAGLKRAVSRLEEFGFSVVIHSTHHDRLVSSASVVDVLVRILQECCSNAIKYAQPASNIHILLETEGQDVSLRFISEVRINGQTVVAGKELSSGQGLVGILERVRLLGGRSSIGPSRNQWIVEVLLPVR